VRADSGSWSTPEKVSAATNVADRHPSVIADGDGAFVAIWESKALQSSGANLSLRASWSSDGGKSWSTSMAVASYADAMSQRARLSSDSDGTVRAVRYDSRSSDWRWKVFTAVLNRSQGWGEPKMLGGTGNVLGRRLTRASSRSPVTGRPSAPSATSLIRYQPGGLTSLAPAMVRRATVAAADLGDRGRNAVPARRNNDRSRHWRFANSQET